MSHWDGIDEFVAVATAGSFVKGAEALTVSPSHISRAIAKLEQRIQAPLFFRTTRTVTLTDKGRTYLEYCRRLIAERDEAFALVSEDGEPLGELKLTCPTALGERFVAPIIRQFCQQNAKLSVVIELTNRVVDLVAEGFDLAIRTGYLENSRLVGTRIASRRFVTCAAPSYLDRFGRPRDLDELDQHECVIGTALTWHFSQSDRERLFRPKGRWRCNSGETIVGSAVAGMGICHLPEFYVRHFLDAGKLEVVLECFRPDDEPIWAVYPQQRHVLPRVRKLVELLRRELSLMLSDSPI